MGPKIRMFWKCLWDNANPSLVLTVVFQRPGFIRACQEIPCPNYGKSGKRSKRRSMTESLKKSEITTLKFYSQTANYLLQRLCKSKIA